MTSTPYVDEEELKRLEDEALAEERALQEAAPAYSPKTAPQTMYKEATPAENKAAGNVQPVKSPQQQAVQQLTGGGQQQPQQPLNRGSGFIYGSGDPNATLGEDIGTYAQRTLEGLGSVGMGIIDFGMDAIGRIPGAEWIDDAWDAKTKFKNPGFQKVREVSSVLVPSIGVGAASRIGTAGMAGSPVARGLSALGINVAGDVAINAISDQSEGETVATIVKEAAPWLPVPDALVVKDSDPPEVRRQKTIYESAGISIVGDIIGYSAAAGRGVMDWFKPKNKVAQEFMASEVLVNADAPTATRLSELDTRRLELQQQRDQIAATPALDQETLQAQLDILGELDSQIKALDSESGKLTKQYVETGTSDLTESPLESFVERQQISRDTQVDEVGKGRLLDDPEGVTGVDPMITPSMFPDGSTATLSIPPGSIARNMADTTAIKLGTASGSPAPILSERAYHDLSKGSAVSRNIIEDLAEGTRATGDFDAVVQGFRYTKAQMSDAAWKIYNDIIGTDKVSDLKKLFLDNRDVKNLLDGRSIKYVNDVQAEAIGFAMRELTDKYIGQVVTETSARVMDTVGREVADIAEGYKAFPETADLSRTTEMLGDRLAFLMEEYALNKYIAGWSLKNQDRWQKFLKEAPDKEAAIKQITEQFDLKVQEKNAQAQGYRDMIRRIATERPDAAQPLIDAFALSRGDVDTLDKLMKWSANQLSPMGLLKSGDEGLNAFAQGVWAVRYNNMLSGISALKAITGNTVSLTLRTTNAFLGTGIGALMGRNTVDDLRKATHVYGSFWQVNKRALNDSWDTFKRTWNNGKWGNDGQMDFRELAREDLVTDYNPNLWDTLADMEQVWEKDGNWGRLAQYRFARFMYDLGNWRWFKYGTNAMISADSFVQTTVASQMARARAWDEISSIGYKGEELAQQLAKAEKMAYDEAFDAMGNLTDAAAKNAAGEIALNLDDETAAWLTRGVNKLPILKPFFMFPKTGVNGVKMAMSYTPIATLPGMNRYSKVLWAGDDIDKIKEALMEHGIAYDGVPNGMAIFKGLEAEYRGRVAFGALTASSLLGYALGGNIRGNGPINPGERKKLRDNFGWQPKTINVAGKWVSYAGYEPLDTILTLVGDLAYYSRDIGSTLTESYTDKLAWTISATFVNKSWTAGLEPVVAVANGDETAISRFLANEVRAAIPMSGALGVVSNAITSSQKDIYKDLVGYVTNKVPGFSSQLPEQIDIYTGKPLNDIDNPVLRALNAVNPVKISEGTEPWRQWLIDSGWDGIQMIRKDSTGNHEYTPQEREVLYRYIGEQQLWKQFDKLSKNKKYNDQLDRIRAMRVQGRPSEEIQAAQSEVYSVMNDIMTQAQKAAELRMQQENEPMWRSIQESLTNKNMMRQGRIDDAARAADRRKAEIERLTQMYR
ncbi:internal virion protein [Synechococcus phage DSL-LC07]|nr:internal virion protein [Synechococcus phage DSL-LC07]